MTNKQLRSEWEEAACITRWFDSALSFCNRRNGFNPVALRHLEHELNTAKNKETKAHEKYCAAIEYIPDED